MKKVDALFLEYGESHKNATNKIIHWICIPVIMLSLIGLLQCVPFPFSFNLFALGWDALVLVFALVYYLRLSVPLALGFTLVIALILWTNHAITAFGLANELEPWMIYLSLFIVAWIGQFIGHAIEGKRPSFFKDLQFLLIGPAWLLHFIYKKLNWPY